MDRNKIIQTMQSVLVRISALTYQVRDLSDAEKYDSRRCISDDIDAMDRFGIPWKVQNALFYTAEHNDCRCKYISDLLDAAAHRAGYSNMRQVIETC